jgi:3-isopropylmalate/(R)-2-methylmalate dehydratase small subunit
MAKAIVLGDSINTDQIISGEYVRRDDYTRYLFAKFRDDINRLIQGGEVRGRIIVAGRNFGMGSSRERAAIGLKEVGIAAVVAHSYDPTFERNAINCGLRIYRFRPGVHIRIRDGDELVIDPAGNLLYDVSTGDSYPLMETPRFVQEIWEAGGLIGILRKDADRQG